MRHRRPAPLLVVLSTLAATAGCAPQIEPDVASSDSPVIGQVKGSTLGSGYAAPGATYLMKRDIRVLERVGALTLDVGRLASRVDGIIANQPADGPVSVQELVKIEQPGFIETLFPEEKAALPKLWAPLETTADAPRSIAPPDALPVIAPVDDSTPAGPLTRPDAPPRRGPPRKAHRRVDRERLGIVAHDQGLLALAGRPWSGAPYGSMRSSRGRRLVRAPVERSSAGPRRPGRPPGRRDTSGRHRSRT